MPSLPDLQAEAQSLANPTSAVGRARFFQTGPGQYAEGDRFLGLTVPEQRTIARRYHDLPIIDLQSLLQSPFHEHRFIALVILTSQYESAEDEARPALVDFYLSQTAYINSWDLVDASAPYILGHYLRFRDDRMLDELARSEHLWTRRIAIVATLGLLKIRKTQTALRVAELLLSDTHDLIHKAVGWALREVGKIDRPELLAFLRQHYERLPRTSLRYAIEHLAPEARKAALQGKFEG